MVVLTINTLLLLLLMMMMMIRITTRTIPLLFLA